jgi:NUBPL iron-transfer P-loop NTPase
VSLKTWHPTKEHYCTDSVLKLIQDKCPELLSDKLMVSIDLFPSSSSSSSSSTSSNQTNSSTTSTTTSNPTGGGGYQMALDYDLEFWGSIPFDPQLLKACEKGVPYIQQAPHAPASKALLSISEKVLAKLPVETMEIEE